MYSSFFLGGFVWLSHDVWMDETWMNWGLSKQRDRFIDVATPDSDKDADKSFN